MSQPPTISLPRYGIFNKELAENWTQPVFVKKQLNPLFRITDNSIGWQYSPNSIRVEMGAQVNESIKNGVLGQMEVSEYMTLGFLMEAIGFEKFTILHVNDCDGQTVVTANDFHHLFRSIPVLLEGFQSYQKHMLANKSATGL